MAYLPAPYKKPWGKQGFAPKPALDGRLNPGQTAFLAAHPAKSGFIAAMRGRLDAGEGFSPNMIAAIGKIMADAATPAPAAIHVAAPRAMADVAALFARAGRTLARPTIRINVPGNDAHVRLSLAGPASKNAGCVYVAGEGDAYYGRITPAGDFLPSLKATIPEGLTRLLIDLGAEPAEVAAAYGKATGCCCFCARALTDERSTAAGYGPICAGHYELPWGDDVKPALLCDAA